MYELKEMLRELPNVKSVGHRPRAHKLGVSVRVALRSHPDFTSENIERIARAQSFKLIQFARSPALGGISREDMLIGPHLLEGIAIRVKDVNAKRELKRRPVLKITVPLEVSKRWRKKIVKFISALPYSRKKLRKK